LRFQIIWNGQTYDWSDSSEGLEKAYALANKAVMLDENDSNAYTNLGLIHMRRRSYDLAEHCCRKAMALNPNSPICTAALGILYGYLGKTDEAVTYLQQARVIDPFFEPTWYWYRFGFIDFVAGRYCDAINHLLRSATSPHWLHGYLAACYALGFHGSGTTSCSGSPSHGSPVYNRNLRRQGTIPAIG
jgi:adenylate cyclase